MPRLKDRTDFGNHQFEGFGESIIARDARQSTSTITIPADRLAARKVIREQCPLLPGIYGWLDRDDQINYVGKSKSLRKRLLSYFSKTPPDEKMHRIVRNSVNIVWEPVCHELLALIREQEMIHRWRPSYNTQGQPHRRRPAFVSISGGDAPNAFLARSVTAKARYQYGPIAGTRQLSHAIECLNYAFKLRDCSDKVRMRFSNQFTLFENVHNAKCLRFELNSCPGPCAGACSKNSYDGRVDNALRFLNGEDLSILETLQLNMERASSRLSFERAAVMRDQLESLRWLSRRLTTLRTAQYELNCVYEVPGFKRTPLWILLDAGQITSCFKRPSGVRTAEVALQKLGSLASDPGQVLPDGPLATNWLLIVISWFRKHPQHLSRLVPVPAAISHCEEIARKKRRKTA